MRKALHIGIDLAASPWSGTLIRALPENVENHGTHADDGTAAYLQLHRPKFPALKSSAGPRVMNRMARVMIGYDLVVCHGERAFPATMGHTLFGQALKLPPLVHYHDGVDAVQQGWWSRFRHRLGFTRTQRVVVPTEAAARSVNRHWHVPGPRLHILPPLFPDAPKAAPKPDTIPRVLKRKDEKWIGMRATDALALASGFLKSFSILDPAWHLVAFGTAEETDALRAVIDKAGFPDRLHVTSRFYGPGEVAGLLDLAIIDASDGKIPPDLPALMAAGVAVVSAGPAGLDGLLPPESTALRVDPADKDNIGPLMLHLADNADELGVVGRANAAFAAAHADPTPHLALLAGVLGLASLEEG